MKSKELKRLEKAAVRLCKKFKVPPPAAVILTYGRNCYYRSSRVIEIKVQPEGMEASFLHELAHHILTQKLMKKGIMDTHGHLIKGVRFRHHGREFQKILARLINYHFKGDISRYNCLEYVSVASYLNKKFYGRKNFS